MKGHSCFTLIGAFIIVACTHVAAYAQPNTTIELKDKPKRYENRKLRSERTGEKKLGVVGRAFQNTFTHYNYYFNANNKLNEIIALARSAQKDDYNKLLPYYNYSLDATAAQSGEIDSVLYKLTSGLLLHDLRNDWTDDLYLLLGKTFLHRKDLDSAIYTFQYINYAYAPKESGGYDIPIGSNAAGTNGVFTVATDEKNSIFKKSPVRNEALLWLSRSFIEADRSGEALGILEILRHDPNFPKRLKDEWNEVNGFLHYKQKNYDSAAYFITKSLDLAVDKADKGRKAFLAAQLYELANDHAKAVEWFNNAAKFTTDPVMEVYANLFAIRAATGDTNDLVEKKKADLLKLAKRDKYESYRSIIYYVTAQLELERKNYDAAYSYLKKSIEYSTDPNQKNVGFLLLGDINFANRSYSNASKFYDSLQIASVTDVSDLTRVNERKPPLKTVAANIETIRLQDSLQMLASLSEDERNTILKKAAKQQKNQQGIALSGSNTLTNTAADNNSQLFTSTNTNNNSGRTEWYFNNASLRSTGFNDFRNKWGNRPNADNWRRSAAISSAVAGDPNAFGGDVPKNKASNNAGTTVADLNNNLPLTPDAVSKSNKLITDALLQNAKTYQYEFKDGVSAAEAYKQLLNRFPKSDNREEALYNYFQLLQADKNVMRADSVKNILRREYPNGLYIQVADNPGVLANKERAAADAYKSIYDLFVEGRFTEAVKEKTKADSIFGSRYWTPQLLFIESVYYIQERQDSTAIAKLTQLSKNFSSSPVSERAATMIDVLKRRAEIENYLTNLQIERKQDEVTKPVDLNDTKITEAPKKDLIVNVPVDKKIEVKKDTIAVAPTIVSKQFIFRANAPHYVVIVLDKVAPAFVNEVKNAFNRYNQQNFFNQRIALSNIAFTDQYTFVLLSGFATAGDAVNYTDKVKPIASSRIVPWLSADKIKFTVIDEQNLQLLTENKDLEGYRKLLDTVLPGKF